MSSRSGWVKAHRSFLDWEWFRKGHCFKVMMALVFKANYKDRTHRGTKIPRGSLIIGRELFASELGISISQLRTSLSHLQSTGEVTIKSSRKGTIIQVVKYEDYQSLTSDLASESTSNLTSKLTSKLATLGRKEEEKNTMSDQAPPAEDGEFGLFEEEIEVGPTIEEEAERVWKAYPRNNKRADAIKKIKLVLKDHSADFLIEKINAYALTVDNPQYYEYATTWFNGKRYEEDFAPPQPKHNF